MKFFDLVATGGGSVQGFADRLGYCRIFSVGTDVEIVEDLKAKGPGKKIVRSDDVEVIAKSLRQNDVLGMLPAKGPVSKKTLEIVKKEDKLLFVPLSEAISQEHSSQALVRMRSLIRSAMMSKVRVCVVSLASDRASIMSSMQMLEVSAFLGIDDKKTKEALCALGALL
jgi:RNase P/RNase MRP subunit p30